MAHSAIPFVLLTVKIDQRRSEHFDASFSPAYSFGFDFAEPQSDPSYASQAADFVDSTFTVTLLTGLSVVDTFTFNAPNDTAAFVGVWTDAIFNRVQIRETTGGIDDEYFGRFYTGIVPIPEPSIWTSLILGGASIGCVIRKRHC